MPIEAIKISTVLYYHKEARLITSATYGNMDGVRMLILAQKEPIKICIQIHEYVIFFK